jgi:hypothetical protein
VDANGTEAGHILYDAMGSVVEISPELPETLVSHLDTTGLQWDGLRYYDPLVGIYTQPNPFGGVPEAPQSLNGYGVTSGSVSAAMAQGGGMPPLAVDVGKLAVNLDFLSGLNWWVQQSIGQGVTYGSKSLAPYSLIRFSVSASRHKLLTRLPEKAVELLGGRQAIESLAAKREIHTLSTQGMRLVRGQPVPRSTFNDFTKGSTKWAGKVDDFFGHSFSWMGTRWFGAASAGVGDAAIQSSRSG